MSRIVIQTTNIKPECKHQILRYIKSRACAMCHASAEKKQSLLKKNTDAVRKTRKCTENDTRVIQTRKSPSAGLDMLSVRYAHSEQILVQTIWISVKSSTTGYCSCYFGLFGCTTESEESKKLRGIRNEGHLSRTFW